MGTENKYTDELLQRFIDGDLDDGQAQAIIEDCESNGELSTRIEELESVRSLLKDHLDQVVAQVDFAAVTDNVLRRCEEEPPAPLMDRVSAWVRELFTYRKPVLIPSVALAAAAVAVLALPSFFEESWPTLDPDVILANAGVEVNSLDTGCELAMVYQMPESKTTVIWIADSSEQGEPTANEPEGSVQ